MVLYNLIVIFGIRRPAHWLQSSLEGKKAAALTYFLAFGKLHCFLLAHEKRLLREPLKQQYWLCSSWEPETAEFCPVQGGARTAVVIDLTIDLILAPALQQHF